MDHSQKAPLPPLQSLLLSSLLTMKGGNLSQLNDYAMTHPACGDCKHCEIDENDQCRLCLSAIFSTGCKTMLLSLGDCAFQCTGCLRCADTGFKDSTDVPERVVFLVFEMFSHKNTNKSCRQCKHTSSILQ